MDLLKLILANAAALGVAVTSIGVFLAAQTLRATHDWNRRQHAAKMIEDWNPRTASHRSAIEDLRPGIIDSNRSDRVPKEISMEDAAAIYDSLPKESPSQDKLWELRFHFIELLNYFEYVAACYYNRVGDDRMIEESFKKPLLMWNSVLLNFIVVYAKRRGFPEAGKPWGPYHDLIAEWSSGKRQRRFRTEAIQWFPWREKP